MEDHSPPKKEIWSSRYHQLTFILCNDSVQINVGHIVTVKLKALVTKDETNWKKVVMEEKKFTCLYI